MTEQEVRDEILKIETRLLRDCSLRLTVDLTPYITQIFALIKEAGYQSSEGCKRCQQQQVDSEKMLNREAAFDEAQLRDEVQYWKDRTYELGGK